MDAISKETFLIIISYLSLRDKIQCALVSKRWKEIIQNNLYSNFTLRNSGFLIQAIENIGEQVRHLCLENCYFDTYNTLSLPGVFLNLKTLYWTSYLPARKLILPRKPVYSQLFEKWNQLETIISFTPEYNPVPLLILESSKLTRLTTLIIQPSDAKKPFDISYSKKLSDCFNHMPVLTNLQLENITASTEYLDKLHRYLPNLEILKLTGFTFSNCDHVPKTVSQSVVKLEHLAIQFKSTTSQDYSSGDQMKSYLLYVDTRYSLLKTLSIEFDDDGAPVPLTRSVEGYIIKILSHLPHLKQYQMRLCPITDMILLTMDENKIEISDIKICLEEYDVLRQFNFVLASKQKDYITDLTIIDTVLSSRAVPNDLLIFDFVRNLKCLTTLEIGCQPETLNFSYELLITIVNELNTLKSLFISVFDNILNPEIALDTYQITETSISVLDVYFIGTGSNKSRFKYLNSIFQFVLKSCPQLKRFLLSGELYFEEFGTISLDVTRNKKLKLLSVLLDNVSYYTFEKSDPPCIRHKNIGVQMNLTSTEELSPTYSVELLWSPEINDILLKDAKPKTKDEIICQ